VTLLNLGGKTLAAALAALALCLITVRAAGEYGAAAVEEGRTYTIAEMLTLAIEDEYLARARYTADLARFGEQPPFLRIAEAESAHVALLLPLLERYNVPVPEDWAAGHVASPVTLVEALRAGEEGERANLRMYEIFLRQPLPDDVRAIFSMLRQAADNHRRAFLRNLARLESGGPSAQDFLNLQVPTL
jgi:hypothetical protein